MMVTFRASCSQRASSRPVEEEKTKMLHRRIRARWAARCTGFIAVCWYRLELYSTAKKFSTEHSRKKHMERRAAQSLPLEANTEDPLGCAEKDDFKVTALQPRHTRHSRHT